MSAAVGGGTGSGGGGAPHPRRRLLVAEGEPHLRRLLSRKLREADYDVEVARDRAETLERLRAETPYDLALVDTSVAESPSDLLRHLRRLEHRQGLPVLVLAARDAVTNRDELLDLGADALIPVPFSAKKLLARIETLLSGR